MEQKNMIKKHLSTGALIKYLLHTSEEIDTLVTCKPDDVMLFTSDQELYEACASVYSAHQMHIPRFIKLIEAVHITSGQRQIITPEQVQSHLQDASQTSGGQHE